MMQAAVPQDAAPQAAASGISGSEDTLSGVERNGTSIHSVINVVRDLTSLMNREVELLRAMQIQEFGVLQGQKYELINIYEAETAALRDDHLATERLDESLREELRDVINRMTSAMRENEAAIRAAKTTNEKLVKAITSAVQIAQNSHQGYSDQGQRCTSGAVSVRVNQEF
jgi:HSP90 family molecular chaperone